MLFSIRHCPVCTSHNLTKLSLDPEHNTVLSGIGNKTSHLGITLLRQAFGFTCFVALSSGSINKLQW